MDHRLKDELLHLVKTDSSIFTFIEECSLDGMWYWDLEKPDEEWMSQKFWQTLGYEPSEKLHNPSEWQEIINPDDLAMVVNNFEKHCKDPTHLCDQVVRYRHKNGSTVWIRCRGMAIRDKQGKPIRMLGAHNNLTKQKESELKYKSVLESKERFFARMSHEIRTPMHGILGVTELLQQQELPYDVRDGLKTISSCGGMLLTLLDDLLSISKLNEYKLNLSLEPVSLKALLGYIHNLFSAKAIAKSISLNIDILNEEDIWIKSDRVRLGQIISNIVSNSIKFTDEGYVSLSAHIKNDSVIVTIEDSGIGINDTKTIFEAYEQEQVKNLQGTGLGLEIVKKLSDLMNYKIDIKSTLNVGTIFEINIGSSISKNEIITSSPNNTDYSKDITIDSILIVDDNEINREVAVQMFSEYCNKIDVAIDGFDAVSKVSKGNIYDLILMDLNMPQKNGFETSIEINAIYKRKNIKPKIYALSADAFETTAKKCKQSGMIGHLAKPFSKKDVVSIIETTLEW